MRVVCEPRALVVHDEGAARGRPARQSIWFHRSAYRYYAKHHLDAHGRPLRWLAAAGAHGAGRVRHRRRTQRSGGDPRDQRRRPRSRRNRATSRGGSGSASCSSSCRRSAHVLLNVVSSLAIIRYLAPDEFGDYAVVVSLVTLCGILCDFGIDKYGIREISLDEETEAEVTGTVVVIRLALSVISFVLVQAVLFALGVSANVHVAAAVASGPVRRPGADDVRHGVRSTYRAAVRRVEPTRGRVRRDRAHAVARLGRRDSRRAFRRAGRRRGGRSCC